MPVFNGTTGDDIIDASSGDDIIHGLAGNDIINGGFGADQMYGDAGNDTFYVDNVGDSVFEIYGGGNDIVYTSVSFNLGGQYIETLVLQGGDDLKATGNGLNNYLIGNSGNNVLNGSVGADRMVGGKGDDTYFVDNVGDLVEELNNGGNDLVYSTISFNLGGQYIERLNLIGTANINAIGNGLDNILVGNSGNNVLNGNAGADTMAGGKGNDTYFVDNAGDKVSELYGQGNDVLYSTVSYVLGGQYIETIALLGTANINATGNGLNNYLIGNAGNNILNGSVGADYMAGGLGNDSYFVDNAADVVVELDGEGNDILYAVASYTLSGQSIERFVLQGSANINATGDANNNNIFGNSGANVIDGGAGADAMHGGGGNDTFIVDNLGDTIDGTNGFCTVRTMVDGYTLTGNIYAVEMLGDVVSVFGTGFTNIITGNAAGNLIDGKGGGDTLKGGLGDDTYYVYSPGDNVIEYAGEGTDTVIAGSTASYDTTDRSIENVILTGTNNTSAKGNELDNHLTGNDGNNTLSGMDGNDVIDGGAGNDTISGGNGVDFLQGGAGYDILDGGAGADTLQGGADGDTYIIDADDTIIEDVDGGFDSVQVDFSYSLAGTNLEGVILVGTANINATGNDVTNDLTGNSGNNILDGGLGADVMSGGAGNDTYYVDNADDVVFESYDGGYDTVFSTASVHSYDGWIEEVVLSGNANADIILTSGDSGGSGNSTLTGNDGDNVIDGGDSYDIMTGGAGADTFVFHYNTYTHLEYPGITVTTYSAGQGRITDYDALEGDKLDLSHWASGYTIEQSGNDTVISTPSYDNPYTGEHVVGVSILLIGVDSTAPGFLDSIIH